MMATVKKSTRGIYNLLSSGKNTLGLFCVMCSFERLRSRKIHLYVGLIHKNMLAFLLPEVFKLLKITWYRMHGLIARPQ